MRKQSTESNPVLIRPASAEEAEAIVTLIHRAFAQYRGRLRPESGALSESAQTIRSATTTGVILIATHLDRIVGCVSIQRKADFAYAGRLSVDPSARGLGIGRRLMAEAESHASGMGAGQLRIDVRLALTENRAFFRALGFVEGSHRCHPGFASPTYVELEKTLI
ncbi:MAG TPA: GNAT family N-acetyltransferase [Dongiaceae bacterium]